MTKKTLIAASVLLILIAAAWGAGGVLAGARAQAYLLEWQSAPQGGDRALRITSLLHDRGLFSSRGRAEVRFEPGCAADPGADDSVTVQVDYSISHAILPSSVMRLDWKATPSGSTADELEAVFGTVSSLTGTGTVSSDGALRTEMSLPEMSFRRSGETLRMAPSKGFLEVDGEALAFGWKVERLVTRGGGQAMEATGIALDLDLKNRYLGTGSARFGVDRLSSSAGTLEGLSLTSEAAEHGDRLDMTLTPAIRRAQVEGSELSDLGMQIALKGLDTRSLEILTRLFHASCGMQSLTADEARKAQEAVVKLLARGFSAGVPRIGGKSAEGGIQGELMLELAEARDGKPLLASQLKSQGRLELHGTLLSPEHRDMIVAMGLAEVKGTSLTAAFRYADGLLELNGRTQDASALLEALQATDERLKELVIGWGRGTDQRNRGGQPR